MNNPLLKQFRNRLANRYSKDLMSMSMTDWIEANTTLRGKPFSVKDYWFQRRILDDMHPNMDVIKCSQVGLTEGQIRKALAFLKRNRGVSLIFTLPKEDMFKRVSKTRVKPIVDKDKVFNTEEDVGSVRSMDLMQFGDSFLYLTGCTEGDATSIPADAVFNDEVDLSPQNMLALFQSRLQGSDFKINQRFGTPTFPQFGIEMGFAASDQHVYLVKCDSCGHWNWPEFTWNFIVVPGAPNNLEGPVDLDESMQDDLDIEGSYVKCEKCHSPLDLGREDNREWVARFPGRTHARGYHVTPFSTGKLPVSYIITQLFKYKKRDYLRGFYNTVLGLAYSDGNIRLDREVIMACFTANMSPPPIDPSDPVWIGIDMGQTCHITVGIGDSPENVHVVRWLEVHVDDVVRTVKDLCETYNVIGGAVDRHPYEPTADEIFEVSNGRVVPVEYRGQKDVNLVYDEFKQLSRAQANRTALLDLVPRAIKNRHVAFSGYGHKREMIIEHLRDLVRDEKPETPASWQKLTGDDHYFHSLGFLLYAFRLREVIRAQYKEDVRTMLTIGKTNFGEPIPGLLGRKNKTLLLPTA